MNRYKELKVWHLAVDFAVEIYKATETFPSEEKFGLTSQVRRSAVSVPSNIAEGAGRNTKGEFKNFLGIANGSACEMDTQLIIANRLGFISVEKFESMEAKVQSIINMNTALQLKL
jgi:four helix bundle protein